MSAEIVQTLVSAFLVIGTALIVGSLGLRRFEAIDRRFDQTDQSIVALRTELKQDIAELRTELKRDIALVDVHVREVGGARADPIGPHLRRPGRGCAKG